MLERNDEKCKIKMISLVFSYRRLNGNTKKSRSSRSLFLLNIFIRTFIDKNFSDEHETNKTTWFAQNAFEFLGNKNNQRKHLKGLIYLLIDVKL